MLLQRLSDARGVSGKEDAVREIILDEIRTHVDEYRVDNIGNLIATVHASGGTEKPHRVMVDAHMDEVGLMITQVDKNGMLRFRPVGGIDPRVLPAKRVLIGQDAIPGVIGIKAVHLVTREEAEKVIKFDQLYIDIGAKKKEEAQEVIRLGDVASFVTQSRLLGRTVMGKAFDDRVGCAVLAELVKERYPIELVAVFSVQEEVGTRGARVAAYDIEPEVAIALEGTICDDLPRKEDVTPVTQMGHGPAITKMDRSLVCDRRLVDLLVRVATEIEIPYQFKAPGLGGTDAGAIHLVREGVPAVAVSVPARYIHTPVSFISLDDFENAVKLMKEALRRLDAEFPWGERMQ